MNMVKKRMRFALRRSLPNEILGSNFQNSICLRIKTLGLFNSLVGLGESLGIGMAQGPSAANLPLDLEKAEPGEHDHPASGHAGRSEILSPEPLQVLSDFGPRNHGD